MTEPLKDTFDFSYTDLKNYRTCPYRFFLKLRAKEKSLPRYSRAVNSRRFVEGWCVHKCLEVWNTMGHWQSGWMFNAVVKTFRDSRDHALFVPLTGSKETPNLIPEVLAEFIRNNRILWREGDGPEKVIEAVRSGLEQVEYWIPLIGLNHAQVESEHRLDFFHSDLGVQIKGAIDLVDHRVPEIYDLKFSKAGYTDWEQLIFYAFVFGIETGRRVERVLTFNPIQEAPIEDREVSEDDLAEMRMQVSETVQTIREKKFEPVPTQTNCFNCPFGRDCEHNACKTK